MILSRTIRTATFRFAAIYVAVFLASVVLLGAIAYFTVRGALERQIEAGVRSEVAALAAAYRAGGMEQLRAIVAKPGRSASWRFRYRIVSPDGSAVVGALNLFESQVDWGALERPGSSLPDAAGIKALTVALDDKHRLSVASSSAVLRDLERVFKEVFLAMLVASLVLGLGGGLLVSSRYLARIDRISSTAQSIIDGDLKQRIPLRSTSDELDRLAATLNSMLDRIHELMESLRQVSNDIAHDLRTPLSRLRQRLEGALAADLPAAAIRESLTAAIADTDSILETFGALLRIAQIETGTRKSGFQETDLGNVVETITDAYAPVLEEQCKRLELDVSQGITLFGDRELLTQLLANLIENAIQHTPEGTIVRIGLNRRGQDVLLTVADNGPGVPLDQRHRLFDRFYRGDPSRKTTGSGLGLSLVKAVADLHNATVDVRDNHPGLLVEIAFPVSLN